MVDIKTIKSNNLFKVSNFTAPRNLPEASNAGFNADAAFVMGGNIDCIRQQLEDECQ